MKISLREKIFLHVNPKMREIILLILGFVKFNKSINIVKTLRYMSKSSNFNHWGDLSQNKGIWEKNFIKISIMKENGFDIARSFFNDDIEVIKTNNDNFINRINPILICVVKNDLKKIKVLYNHYKKIGVENFAILDNNSDDGTFEWLFDKSDIDVFRTKTPYTTNRRQSWINKIISFYGFDRWYIIVDSDELLMYENMENKNVTNLIEHLETEDIKRLRTITIDMYSKIFDNKNENDEDYIARYIYFDTDNYWVNQHYVFLSAHGGMRERMFKGDNNKFSPYLTKYPIIFFEKDDIQYNSHYSYPFFKNFKSPCLGALFHYKFLNSDLKKYQEIADAGSFFNGSYEYKQYIKLFKERKQVDFLYQGSKMYEDSSSLQNIKIIEKIWW